MKRSIKLVQSFCLVVVLLNVLCVRNCRASKPIANLPSAAISLVEQKNPSVPLQVQATVPASATSVTTVHSGAVLPQPLVETQHDIAFQNKYKEVIGKPTVSEKIIGARDLIKLIGASTTAADKNVLTALLNDLFLQQGVMKKDELVALQKVFSDAEQNVFLLAQNQKPIIQQWAKALSVGLELVDATTNLIDSVKLKLDLKKSGFPSALKASFCALQLLDTKLSAVELDKRNNQGLVSVMAECFKALFNARGGRMLEELRSLQNLLAAAIKVPSLAIAIDKTWDAKIAMTVALASAIKEEHVLTKISLLITLVSTMTEKTDAYEKRLLLDEVGKLIFNRKDRALREIEELKKFLITLVSDPLKKNKVFSSSDITRINAWSKIIESTLALLTSLQERVLDSKIKLVSGVTSSLSGSEYEYEKKLCVQLLSEMFAARADLKQADLKKTKEFFESVSAVKALLASNQRTVMQQWLQDLDDAVKVTVGDKTYLEALLNDAVTKKDLVRLGRAVALITHDYADDIKKLVIDAFNTFFAARKTLKRADLIATIEAIDQKKVDGKPFLVLGQRQVLGQWLGIIAKE